METDTADRDGHQDTLSPPVNVKQEPDEMKDFAENTMNELLGWYGYDKVEEGDTENLHLRQFEAAERAQMTAAAVLRAQMSGSDSEEEMERHRPRDSLSNASVDSGSRLDLSSPGSGSELAAQHQTIVSALNNGKSPKSQSPDPGSSSDTPAQTGYITCAWCQKPGIKQFTLKTNSGGKTFCSELCFTQCRRASFKKNKVCDWCKHVRHTVNYVDFQDGEQQLQFCSDKCLNQYKMNIFCKETQEHLQQIQGQLDADVMPSPNTSNQILITPELWMASRRMRKREREREREREAEREEEEERERENIDSEEKPLNLHKSRDEKRMVVDLRDGKEPPSKKIGIASEKLGDSSHSSSISSFDRRLRENREKAKRSRSRESMSTPLSVATSPGSSQLSTSPSVTNTLTPPIMNGGTQSIAPGALMNALAPGLPGHPAWLYPHLMGGAMPGMLPPGMLMPPDQARMPVRVSPATPEGRSTPRGGPPSTSQAAAPSSTQTPHPPPGMTTAGGMLRPPLPAGLPMLPPGMHFPPLPPPGMMPPHPMAGILPPSTLIQPYPVILPIPVPVPIIIPVKTDKDYDALLNIYRKPTPRPKEEIKIKTENPSPESKPAPATTSISVENIPPPPPPPPPPPAPAPTSRTSSGDAKEKIACACCQSEVGRNDGTCGRSSSESHSREGCYRRPPSRESLSYRRPPSGDSDCGIITSSSDLDLEDGVIDLSKDKHSNKDRSSVLNSVDQNKNNTTITIKPGTIPIVSSPENGIPPLVNPLHPLGGHLLPPRDHSYSSRRGLILDAPSVARDRNKSPSPEKRIHLRNPTREMLLNKRRCLRRGIKTK